jgi:hypothetical protein
MATVNVYKCNKCGSLYPDDYFEEWGRKYGIGLGMVPRCEALNSDYHSGIAVNVKQPEKASFPLENCGGTLFLTTMTETDSKPISYNIPALGDEDMSIRAPLMQLKQAEKRPELLSHLKNVVESYKKTGRPVPSHLALL